MAGRLGRPYGLALEKGTPVVVEERIIARAEISRPGAAPGAPRAPITLDVLGKVKTFVEKAGKKGECVSVESLAMDTGISEEEANASISAMKLLEFGEKCCPTHFCSHEACSTMMSKIKRWRGIA
jgi:hypothetical protein